MYVDVTEDATAKQLLMLKSDLQSHVKPERSLILNARVLMKINHESLGNFLLFFNGIIALLFLLSFYQLVLSIDQNLKENKYQIGVLRSMGMNKKDIMSMTLIEATCNIVAATILGFFTGYLLGGCTINMLTTIWESPLVQTIEWAKLGWLIVISVGTVYFGTRISIGVVNKMKISSILKGL